MRMAVLMLMDIEATLDEYDRVNEIVDPATNPPPGLILHVGSQHGNVIRVADVWESEQQFNDFREQRLGPAVGQVLGADAGPPQIEILEVHDLVKP